MGNSLLSKVTTTSKSFKEKIKSNAFVLSASSASYKVWDIMIQDRRDQKNCKLVKKQKPHQSRYDFYMHMQEELNLLRWEETKKWWF